MHTFGPVHGLLAVCTSPSLLGSTSGLASDFATSAFATPGFAASGFAASPGAALPPFGRTAAHVPLTPWPVTEPGVVSPLYR